MPVMKQLTVDGTTYTTVGEVTVTQSLGSGTQVASIDVDGTSTTLYAPTPTTYTLPTASTSTLGGVKVDGSTITIADGVISASGGGGSVEPSTTAPAMDGTAAAGTSVKYARADHVHPTDTSRAAATHAHGNITSAGDITSTATIASGDRLVINDESASKVTNSSITFGTSTTTFLANNGTWQTPAGGGGGGTWTDITNSISLLDNIGNGAFFYDGHLVFGWFNFEGSEPAACGIVINTYVPLSAITDGSFATGFVSCSADDDYGSTVTLPMVYQTLSGANCLIPDYLGDGRTLYAYSGFICYALAN